ncbi:MAG: hypothetical protein Q9178_008022 [Gyalolechia marmorata]
MSKSNDSSKRHDFTARIDQDLHPFAQVNTFNELLAHSNAFRAHDEAPYLHPRILSYIGAGSKKFWTNDQLDGAKDRDYLYQFWKASTSVNTRIELFATWTEKKIGTTTAWVDQEWHCWGAALVNNGSGYGKHLYIWDCDGCMDWDDDVRARSILMGARWTLIQQFKKWKVAIHSISFHGKCLRNTATWALSLAAQPDSLFSHTDPRFRGFRQILVCS